MCRLQSSHLSVGVEVAATATHTTQITSHLDRGLRSDFANSPMPSILHGICWPIFIIHHVGIPYVACVASGQWLMVSDEMLNMCRGQIPICSTLLHWANALRVNLSKWIPLCIANTRTLSQTHKRHEIWFQWQKCRYTEYMWNWIALRHRVCLNGCGYSRHQFTMKYIKYFATPFTASSALIVHTAPQSRQQSLHILHSRALKECRSR